MKEICCFPRGLGNNLALPRLSLRPAVPGVPHTEGACLYLEVLFRPQAEPLKCLRCSSVITLFQMGSQPVIPVCLQSGRTELKFCV